MAGPNAKNWMYLLMAGIFSLLLIALGFKFYYAFTTDNTLVTTNYYEVGRDYDNYVKNQKSPDRKLESPVLTGKLLPSSGENKLPVSYFAITSNTSMTPIEGASVSVVFSRRATRSQDISAKCITDAAGSCELQFKLPGPGDWEMSLLAEDKAGKYNEFRLLHL